MKMLFKDKNGRTLRTVEIKKAAKMKVSAPRLYIEPLSGGGCRLVWSHAIVEDWQHVDRIEMDRSGD